MVMNNNGAGGGGVNVIKKEQINRPATAKKGAKEKKEYKSGEQRNENILCAVLALLKELDESGLELVKRDIERKLSSRKK